MLGTLFLEGGPKTESRDHCLVHWGLFPGPFLPASSVFFWHRMPRGFRRNGENKENQELLERDGAVDLGRNGFVSPLSHRVRKPNGIQEV